MEAATALKMAADALFKFLSSDFVVKELLSIWENDKEIELLAETVEHVRNLLFDVQRGQIEGKSVNEWYQRLRVVFLDAEDFLDKVQTLKKKKDAEARKIKEAEEEIVKPDGKGKQSVAYCCIKMEPLKNTARRFFSSSSNQAKYALEVHNAIKEIRRNFEAITRDIRSFPLLGNEPINRSERALTADRARTCIVNASEIIGRDGDKDEVVELLLRPSVNETKISVVSVVGMGGMGKTTVAQLVYDDESWQEKCQFDKRFWVSDSKKYDLESLLKHVLKSIDPNNTSLDNLTEDHLSERFVNKIQGKSFLLVLDDVDYEDGSNWENLMNLLKKGNKEKSRVLVTTRSRKVASVVGSLSDSTYELKGLSRKDSMELFERHASTKRWDGILAEIVEKCCGVPLALKVIGSLLRGADAVQWENVRDCKSLADITDESDEGNKLIRILKLSYNDLDPTVKQCFSFCALFPKNFLIPKKILSRICVDNIHFETKKGESPESVCNRKLRILYNRCFLQVGDREMLDFFTDSRVLDEFEDATHFKMHDLMCDLSKDVAGDEILVVDPYPGGDNFIVEEKVRHLFLANGSAPTFHHKGKGKRLRSILKCSRIRKLELSWILSECPALRLLDLGECGIGYLPSSVGKLIHLRHLCLAGNEFETLPDSICELINLKHLDLRRCRFLTHLPSGMGALTSLLVLDMGGCAQLKELPGVIGKLINLQYLSLGRRDFRGLYGFEVVYMKHTHFTIDSVRDYGDYTARVMIPLDTPDCSQLEELPSAMGKLINLQYLYIGEGKYRTLPDFVCELINLKHLHLDSCTILTQMPSGMGALTSLRVLRIDSCEGLEELPSSIVNLVSLTDLFLDSCFSLRHLPFGMDALTSLQVLYISKCGELKLPSCIGNMVSLRQLHIEYKGSHMPFGVGKLASLEGLKLICPILVKLPRGIQKLNNLRKLSLECCPSLARMPSGMGALLSLCRDAIFIVGHPDSSCAQLEELLPLSDFPTNLKIELSENFRLKAPTGYGEAFLLNKKSLRKLCIKFRNYGYDCLPPHCWPCLNGTEEDVPHHMDILARLQPPPNLESFSLDGYRCMTFSPCLLQHDSAFALPNLVELCLRDCNKVRSLPFMKELKWLKRLKLSNLSSLEYIEENVSATPFCPPQLESLVLEYIPKWKGWCRGLADGVNEDDSEHIRFMQLPSFPRIVHVRIMDSSEFWVLWHLFLSFNIADLKSGSVLGYGSLSDSSTKLKLQKHDNGSVVLEIKDTNATLRNMVEIFRAMSDHLTEIEIGYCSTLKTLPGLQHLTALRYLTIKYCSDFTWEEEEEEEEEKQSMRDDEIQSVSLHTAHYRHVSWTGLTSLETLTLWALPRIVRLPEGIQFLPSLKKLDIYECENLQIPEWLQETFERREKVGVCTTQFHWVKKETDAAAPPPPL